MTETDVINLRRTIYLTIMSSMDFEEAGHKLTKIPLEPGQEMEIVTMILECCSQEKTYIRWGNACRSTCNYTKALRPPCRPQQRTPSGLPARCGERQKFKLVLACDLEHQLSSWHDALDKSVRGLCAALGWWHGRL